MVHVSESQHVTDDENDDDVVKSMDERGHVASTSAYSTLSTNAAVARVIAETSAMRVKLESLGDETYPRRSGDEYVCDACGMMFVGMATLKRHVVQVHNTPKRKFAREEFFERFTPNDGCLVCDRCPYRCDKLQRHRFFEHYRIHTGERPFVCAICGKSSRTKGMLKKHLQTVHEDVRKYTCDECGKAFSERRYMVEHRRTHTGEKPIVCDVCGKRFAHTASLFVHKKLHRNERTHVCNVCNFGFNTSSVLKKHLRRHYGERNHRCDVCGKAFVDRQMLKCHKASHSEDRPFKCDVCEARFKLKKHLTQHGKVHKKAKKAS